MINAYAIKSADEIIQFATCADGPEEAWERFRSICIEQGAFPHVSRCDDFAAELEMMGFTCCAVKITEIAG